MPDRFQQRRTAARVGLLHRVIGVRRAQAPLPEEPAGRFPVDRGDPAAAGGAPGTATPTEPDPVPTDIAQRLERRLARVEAQVEDLQDALHRASVRQQQHLDDVEHRLEPAVLARALSDDARRRGL